ncbi:MAG: hypothetical protein KTR20_10865 [Cellvibrionaceae bacterium]|nr:hypothetical protein [Cellvibrionaceae bacterium]
MDTGLHGLVALARFYQLPAEPDQLVNAMAAYDVPLGAGNVVPQDVQDYLPSFLF